MTRRKIHQTILFGITIAMFLVAAGFWIFKEGKIEVFAITAVAYLVTLGILTLPRCWIFRILRAGQVQLPAWLARSR